MKIKQTKLAEKGEIIVVVFVCDQVFPASDPLMAQYRRSNATMG
jgi:hypothetical protein